MIPENNKYPVFEANQVLNADHLNCMNRYLGEQGRLTRAVMTGVGIVCGLKVHVTPKNATYGSVTITKGYGITSEGFVAVVEDTGFEADRYRRLEVLDGYKPLLPADAKVANNLLELLDAEHEHYEEGDPLKLADLKGMVVLLYVELLETDLKICTPGSCDDRGKKVTVSVRKLLVPDSWLDDLHSESAATVKKLKSTGDFFPNLASRLNLKDIRMPRFDVPASDISDTESIIAAYKKILVDPLEGTGKSLFRRVGEALDAAQEAFSPLLPIASGGFTAKLTAIEAGFMKPDGNKALLFQYHHDFLDDLIQAYEEFRWKALELMSLCNPPGALFPRHLELGELEKSTVPGTPADEAGLLAYRHFFRPSPAIVDRKAQSRELHSLFQRLRLMVDEFDLPVPDEKLAIDSLVRITPSRSGDTALSGKPIPCYYDLSAALLDAWDFRKSRIGRKNLNTGYRIKTDDSILFDLEQNGFFRIEGHIGLEWTKTLETLKGKIRSNRLPFDVLVLQTGKPATPQTEESEQNYLGNFLKKHPGIEHIAGVPRGGTFVLVCHSQTGSIAANNPLRDILVNLKPNVVVADFSLPYRISETRIVPDILVGECEYGWIDSIRHMNNLALRGYRIKASSKAPASSEQERARLADNYIVRVCRYTIQGRAFVDVKHPRDISVPLADLRRYGHSAIMQKLNELFPLGLVFDHAAGTGNVLIRSIKGHQFRIEFEGVQGNRIRYAYDQNGMYRRVDDSWEPVGIQPPPHTCRIVAGAYDEKQYRWLHEKFGPAGLTEIQGPTAKEAIEWEKLVLARARRYATADKLPIFKPLLSDIASAVRAIDPKAGIVLVGSWANGSWVSRNNEENVKSVGSASAWKSLIALTAKVTGKTGISGIDLLIDSEHEITPEMIRVPCGYRITMFRGKKDAQKGLVL
ncbi:MAG: hypothetical protein HGB00_05720 [Chlorobiaceae bacterium]|nr:hypothetical protein [Chlorobiaceae bacterium]